MHPPLRTHVYHFVLIIVLFALGVAGAYAKMPGTHKSAKAPTELKVANGPTQRKAAQTPAAHKFGKAVTHHKAGLLRWDGQIFTTRKWFRRYLVSRGVNWPKFVRLHPAAIGVLSGTRVLEGTCHSVKRCANPHPPTTTTTTTASPPPTTTTTSTSTTPTTTTTTTTPPTTTTTTTTTTAVTTTSAPSAPSSGYFAASSPWNTPIPSGYPTASNSSGLISRITGSGYGVGVNQGSWTPVVYYAPAGTPRYKAVNQDGWIVDDVPIPSNYVTPADSDAMVVIIDQESGRIYNIPQLRKDASGKWTFGSAGIFNPNGSGWWDGTPGPWSGRAANSSLLSGLITPQDVKAGVINHALALALPTSLNGGHVSPAATGDGTCTSSCVPLGSWFQLDPSLDDNALKSLGFSQGELILAHAMQRYGIYDVDSTNGSISFYAQNTTSPGGSTYGYPSDWSDGINRAFLSHLRLLQPPAAPVYDSRYTYGQPHK